MPTQNLTCVIVEDQLMFLQMLYAMMETMPYFEVVATAQSVAEGIEACELHRPDLLVLDLALADGRGTKVARRLVELHPQAKIIILSGEASTFVCPASLNNHIHAVLDKTQAYDDLAAELKALVPKGLGGSNVRQTDPLHTLSVREYEIFTLIGRGLMSKEIADHLTISLHTVQAHRKRISSKLGTSGPGLTQEALRHYHATLGPQP